MFEQSREKKERERRERTGLRSSRRLIFDSLSSVPQFLWVFQADMKAAVTSLCVALNTFRWTFLHSCLVRLLCCLLSVLWLHHFKPIVSFTKRSFHSRSDRSLVFVDGIPEAFFDRSLFFSIHDFHFKCFAFFPPHFLFPSSLYMTTIPFSFLSFLMVILHFLLFFRFFFLFFFLHVLLLVFLYVYCTCTLWFVELPCAFSMTCVM